MAAQKYGWDWDRYLFYDYEELRDDVDETDFYSTSTPTYRNPCKIYDIHDLKDEDKCVFQDLSFGPCGKYE